MIRFGVTGVAVYEPILGMAHIVYCKERLSDVRP